MYGGRCTRKVKLSTLTKPSASDVHSVHLPAVPRCLPLGARSATYSSADLFSNVQQFHDTNAGDLPRAPYLQLTRSILRLHPNSENGNTMSKRKHDQVEDQEGPKITKKHRKEKSQPQISTSSEKSKGQLKQEKSERRAKQKKGKDRSAGPVTATAPAIVPPAAGVPDLDSKAEEKAERRARKEKKKAKELSQEEHQTPDHVALVAPSALQSTTEISEAEKKEKSERKSKKLKKVQDQPKEEALSDGKKLPAADASDLEKEVKPQKKKHKQAKVEDESNENKSARARFIAFVGNLPYDVTADQIKAHFSSIPPSSVRLGTNKDTGKGKGFAFVEFDNYDKMKTCLKLYHHSIFDPEAKKKGTQGEDPKDARAAKGKGRRINVELTAGGGGKSKERKAKIKTKNDKLGEERERRRINELAEREKTGAKQKGPVETGANATEVQDTRGAVHPSRLSRVSH